MILLHDNLVFYDTTTITVASEHPASPFSVALKDRRLVRHGLTLEPVAQYITFDMSEPKQVKYFAMLNTNFTETATVTISGNDVDEWDTPAVTENATRYKNTWVCPIDGNYRYWRVDFADVDNESINLSVGIVYLGGMVVCPGMEKGQEIPRVSNSISQISETGQAYGDKRTQFRQFGVTFVDIEQDEKKLIDDVWQLNDLVTPLIVLIWEDSLDVEKPMYAILTGGLEWSRAQGSGLLWRLSLNFREVF